MEPMEQITATIENLKKEAIDQITSLSEKTAADHDTTQTAIADVDKKFEDLKKEMDEKFQERSLSLPGLKEEKQKFNLHKAFAGIATGDFDGVKAGFEKEVFDNARAKAQTVNGANGTGYWVPTEVSAEYVDLALAKMPLFDRVTVLRDLVGNFDMPVLLTRPEGDHVAESAPSTEINYTWGVRSWSPKRASGFTKIGNQALLQTAGSLEPIIKNQLTKSLRLQIHSKMINGTGSNSEPLGILADEITNNMTNTDAIGTNGGRFTAEIASQMQADLEEANHDVGGEGDWAFLMRPIVVQGMKLERIAQFSGDSSGEYVFNPIISTKALEDMIGFPIETTTQVPKNVAKGTSTTLSNVILGDWKEFMLGLWQGLKLRTSTEATDPNGNSAFLNDELWIVMDQYYDNNVGDRSKFTRVSDAETTRSNW